ncbi:MAG: hypothetical protein JWM82_375 [Myxococcales bacterium]|nr:hypothetical protein [Myxococcales bacterium]
MVHFPERQVRNPPRLGAARPNSGEPAPRTSRRLGRGGLVAAIGLALAFAAPARAATVVWGGGTGTWATAGNWVGSVAPTASDTASFTGWGVMDRSAWTVTASVGASVTNTKDGFWNTRWTTGTNAAIGQWYKIDLGSTQTFARVVLDDTGDGSDYPPGFDVYVSNDGSTWGSPIASGTGAAPIVTISFANQTARYLKVQLNTAGSHWWSLRETFVYTSAATDETQLSHGGWTATASLNTTAALAIDSVLSTRWDTGTNAANGQWFKVDLGTAVSVTRVEINAYSDQGDYPPSYSIAVSTDDSTYTTVTSGTGTTPFITAGFSAQTARYVKVTCTGSGSNWWSIHDFQVYGAPRDVNMASSVTLTGLILGKGTITQASGSALTLTGSYTQTAGAFVGGDTAIAVQGTPFNVSGGTFTAGSGAVTIAGAVTISGGTVTMGSGTEALQSSLDVTGGTFTAGSGAVTTTGATTISGGGIINGGSSSSLTFGNTLAIGNGTAGTFNANSANVTFTGVVTLQNAGIFNGNTGSGTFSSAPVLTSGTFTVADAGSTGRWTFNQSTTFGVAATLAFPSDKGELSLAPTKVLTVNGPVTSSLASGATRPKVDCNGCSAAQGITVAFGGTSTLNIDGLELDNSVAAGVSIADGATYTSLKRLTFQNNVANSTSTGATHLSITSSNAGGTKVIVVPGCSFDATAQYNVTLSGVSGSTGVRAIFENQSAAVNGARAGASFDLDADTNGDNVADSVTANRYGAVVEWPYASPADTAGTAVGAPVPAFDFNTFAFYGVYATFKNTAGAGTSDRVWMRSADASAAYYYDVPDASGDIVGNPRIDTNNETTAGVDINGDGDTLDTHVRVVYIGTSLGHILKLIDNGTSLAQPASGSWATDFSVPGSVATITSPLISDGTNLYFGGTNAAAAPTIFGVQISGGANEKTLQKTVGAASTVTTAPTWAAYNGSTYLFVGSTVTAGAAHVYRVRVSPGALIDTDFAGSTANINGGVNLMNNRAYAATNAGKLYVLDASNFTAGFTTLAGFPYSSVAASPIQAYPFVDGATNYAYFGDNAGKLYVVTDTGTNFTGYPYSITGAPQLPSTPLYRRGTGTIAVGASDGYVYFINRHADVAGNPAIRKRYFVGTGTVSAVSFNSNSSQYMAATSDGRMTYIAASDVGTDSDGFE